MKKRYTFQHYVPYTCTVEVEGDDEQAMRAHASALSLQQLPLDRGDLKTGLVSVDHKRIEAEDLGALLLLIRKEDIES